MDRRLPSGSAGGGCFLVSPSAHPRGSGVARSSAARGAFALVVVAAIALVAAGCGGSTNFTAQATSVCTSAQSSLEALRTTPVSVSEALETEHSILDVYTREVDQLQALRPPPGIAGQFRAGVADNQTLVGLLGSMLQRPDFVQLSLTLPHHPALMPAWLKAWLAQSQELQANARSSFSQVGIPACEKTLD
jgi:hypothetical protein